MCMSAIFPATMRLSLYEGHLVTDCRSQKFKIETVEHAGTHMDAPSHFYEQGWTIADIPVERLIANGETRQ